MIDRLKENKHHADDRRDNVVNGSPLPLRVAVVIPKYGLTGGAESFVCEMTERLAAMPDIEMHVLANRWRKLSANVAFHKLPIIPFPRWLQPISFAWNAMRTVRRLHFDIVHAHDRLLGMDLFTFHGIPHSIWTREIREKKPSLFDLATGWVEKKGLSHPRFRAILPVSSLAAGELTRVYDLPGPVVRIQSPGVSLQRFDRLDRNRCRQDIRSRHGLDGNDIVIVFVSMNFELKRLKLVMEGMAGCVRNTALPLKLVVAGKGHRTRYVHLARQLNIEERVVFAGEIGSIEPYYLASDIFALPSRFDAFAMAVLEAMAAGLPVIITPHVGSRDLVADGTTGFLLPESPTAEDMAGAMEKLADENVRRQMGRRARQVAERHTWDRSVQEIAALYHQMAGKPW